MGLTRKQRVFVNEYLQCWNATEAARRAGYSEKTAYSIGHENLRKPEIAEVIRQSVENSAMGAEEALRILADHARADIGDFMATNAIGFELAIDEARKQGKTHLIKKVKQRTTYYGSNDGKEDKEDHWIEIELHDSQAALDKILRVHGKYRDTVEHTGEITTKTNEQQFDRGISTLVDALRKIIPDEDAEQ